MTRSKVKIKVTRPLKLEILRFSKCISSSIYFVSWQMTTDSETTEQYLTFIWSRFLISVLVLVSRDFELVRVSVQFMLLQLQLHSLGGVGVRRRPSVPYGANFYDCDVWRHLHQLVVNSISVLYLCHWLIVIDSSITYKSYLLSHSPAAIKTTSLAREA